VDGIVRLSVVVGTYNRRDQILRCIDTIFDQTCTPITVYVADAGSTDGTIEALRERQNDRLIPVFANARLGQARGYNNVFKGIDTPYVAWLSDDNIVVNHSLDTAISILDADDRIGMVGLKVRDIIGPFTDAPYLGGVSKLGILNVNQGVLRTPLMQQVGGFSEAFRDYGIDPDLTAKVLYSGYEIVYTKEVGIHHFRNWEGTEMTPAERTRQQRYLALYDQKWGTVQGSDLVWKAKKRLWQAMQQRLGIAINSHRQILGQNGRDWCNVLTSRYVSLFDPLWSVGRPYHLRQRCARSEPRATLPADPIA
jgi:GT2 family glycosyltransferase